MSPQLHVPEPLVPAESAVFTGCATFKTLALLAVSLDDFHLDFWFTPSASSSPPIPDSAYPASMPSPPR